MNFASAMDRGSSRQFSPMHFNLSLGTSAVEYLAFVFIKIENFYLKIPSNYIDETMDEPGDERFETVKKSKWESRLRDFPTAWKVSIAAPKI